MHASRTESSFGMIEWRTGEERVDNLPRRGGYPPEMAANTAYGCRTAGLAKKAVMRAGRGLGPISLLAREGRGLSAGGSWQAGGLEAGRGGWNSWWSGEMRRDQEEHPWRRRPTGPELTLRREGVGSERD